MKVLGGETNLNAPISVGSARVVRVFNSDSSNLLVTRKTSGGTTVGTFMVPAGEVVYCEKDYTDTLEGNVNLQAARVAFSPMMSFVSQTADPVPTYTYSVSATSVDEGGSFTTTCTTTNVADGTNLYWELTGNNLTAADFSSGALTGTASVSNNSFSFSHTAAQDSFTEGDETVTIKLYSDSGRSTQVGNTVTVTIVDTSTTPAIQDYSVAFDGVDDKLVWAATDDFTFGLGAYTVEFWVNFDHITDASGVFYQYTNQNGGFVINITTTGVAINKFGVGDVLKYSSPTISGQWIHYAFVRESTAANKTYIFMNGRLVKTGTDSTNWNLTQISALGGNAHPGSTQYAQCRISNFRIVKGTAVYTNDFTPILEPLTNITNTKVLCCNKDSVTGSTVTPGSVDAQGDPTASSETVNGFATGAVVFDGDDSLIVGNGSGAMDLADNDFTIECWFKAQTSQSPGTHDTLFALSAYGDGSNSNAFSFYAHDNGGLKIFNRIGGGYQQKYQESGLYSLNTWVHFAWNRNGTTNKIFINGIETGTYEDQHNFTNGQKLYIGANDYNQNGTANQYGLTGRISNVRVTIGQTLYNSNFTPSTSPLTTTSQGATESNVKLLCCKSSSSTTAVDVGPQGVITTGGSPAISNTDPFELNHAVMFDGNDGIRTATNSSYKINSSDFTLEVWVKCTQLSGTQVFLDSRSSSTQNTPVMSIGPDGIVRGANVGSSNNQGGPYYEILGTVTSIMENKWYHVAWTRTGGTNRLFLNGNLESSATDGTNWNGGPGFFDIGAAVDQTNYGLRGSMSNLRITIGQALYTSTFTPLTEPLTTTSQGATESNVKFLGLNSYSEFATTKMISGWNHTSTWGNPKPTRSNPFDEKYSFEFDGTDDWLFYNDRPPYPIRNWWSQAYTVEYWIKADSFGQSANGGSNVVGSQTETSTGEAWSFGPISTGEVQWYYWNGSVVTVPSGRTISTGKWYHLAFVFDGSSTLKQFVNGDLVHTATKQGSPTGNSHHISVGRVTNNLGQGGTFFDGRISNLRITHSAVYTADFSPPFGPITALPDTKLLALGQDWDGTSAVMPLQDGVFNGSGFTSFGGGPAVSTEDPFDITNGYSVDFDGNDYLSIADDTDFDLTSGDFTIECWYYPRTNNAWVGLMGKWPNGNYHANNSWVLEPVGSTLSFYYCSTNGNLYNANASGSVQENQWQHCAVTKSGNTINVWLNGAKGSDHTLVGNMQNSSSNTTIGGYIAGGGWADGLISNLRLTKGQALYTSNFTPSSTPLTMTSQGAISSNVKFLGCQRSIETVAEVTPNHVTIGGGDPVVTTSDPFS